MKSEYINCKNCKDDCHCRGKNITPICVSFTPAKTTNADRIRAMTDKELAEFIEYLTSGCDYMSPKCYASEFCTYGVCHRAWLDWLKQEVKDD